MPCAPLPERQRKALFYLIEHGEALIHDIASTIRDDRATARNTMLALVQKGLVEQQRFTGMVNDGTKMHRAPHLVFRPTAKGEALAAILTAGANGDKMEKPKPKKRPTAAKRLAAMEVALLQFIEAVEVTGGVQRIDQAEGYVPVADIDWPGWLDLGEAYLSACKAMDRRPKVTG